MRWPDDRKFAFTIFDDTDRSTLENTRPVYDFLAKIGVLATKSVWPIKGTQDALIPGTTCDDPDYLAWTLDLQAAGFEIGFHNATFHTAERDLTIRALDRFRELYGHDPRTAANHASNGEAIYWGSARLTGANAMMYRWLQGLPAHDQFSGHIPGSPYFWGDVCQERIRYVRNFVFSNINTLAECPQMPYFDADRAFVNRWFASSEGATVESFCDTIESSNQESLEADGGACIMYTHFGKGFFENGRLDPRFERLMLEMSERNGWFTTTETLLDFLKRNNDCVFSDVTRRRLERRWLVDTSLRRARQLVR